MTVENRQKFTIAITRPQNQAREWQKSLESAGFGVFLCPLLNILPLNAESQNNVHQNLREFLGEKSAIVFVSPNAARFALTIESAEFWANHALFAVGLGTQKILKKHGLNAEVPKESQDSEGLLKLLETQTFKKIAIIRGDHGREFLGDALKKQGFDVAHFGVYKRETCDKKTAESLFNKAKANEIDAILITSSESLIAWLSALKLPRLPAALVKFPLFVIHPRIAKVAQKLGFENVVEAADDKAFVDFFDARGIQNGEEKEN